MIIKGGFLTMGTKRVGLARMEALMENLKREIIDDAYHLKILQVLGSQKLKILSEIINNTILGEN